MEATSTSPGINIHYIITTTSPRRVARRVRTPSRLSAPHHVHLPPPDPSASPRSPGSAAPPHRSLSHLAAPHSPSRPPPKPAPPPPRPSSPDASLRRLIDEATTTRSAQTCTHTS